MVIYCFFSLTFTAEEMGAEYADFADVVKMSDFVVCICPLTVKTKKLFNKDVFSIMKSTAVFINTSRFGGFFNINLSNATHARRTDQPIRYL